MDRMTNDLSSAAHALLAQTMTAQHWNTVEETLQSLRSRYRFFDESASYCFDAGWSDTLQENEQRLKALRPQIERLAACRLAPAEAASVLLELAGQPVR